MFARVRETMGMALSRALREALIGVSVELERQAGSVADSYDRQAMQSAARTLGRESIVRSARVPEELARRVLRNLERTRDDDALSLLEHEALETQILAGALAAAVREELGADYVRYAGRIQRLVGRYWAEDDANPLGARTLASAMVAVLGGVAETANTRRALRQALVRELTGPIATAIRSADSLLHSEGIVPLEPPAGAAGDAAGQPGTPDSADVPRAPDRRRSSDRRASPERRPPPGRREPAGPPQAERREPPPPSEPPVPPEPPTPPEAGARPRRRTRPPATSVGGDAQSVARDAAALGRSALGQFQGAAPETGALRSLQTIAGLSTDAVAFAHRAGLAPFTRDARAAFFAAARKGLAEAAVAPGQIAMTDVVAAMFDYVVDDARIPEPVKPLVWRLQGPSLSLSLLDPGYLGEEPRSLRRLVENFGAIAVAYADELTRDSELFGRLETVVWAVEVVAGALKTRSSVIATQAEREYTRAARKVGELVEQVASEREALESPQAQRNRRDYARRPGRDEERQVTAKVRALIDRRLQNTDVPDSARDFLHKVWFRHMRTAALRSGEDSVEFQSGLQVVDDLVWSLDSRESLSRRELAQRIPPLIRLISQGVSEIGAKDDEYRLFFDELFLIHLRRMQRSIPKDPPKDPGRERAAGSVSADARDRRRPGPSAVADPDPGAGNAAGARSMAIPPAPGAAEPPIPGSRRLPIDGAEAFAQLVRGDWIEFEDDDGVWRYAQIARINPPRTVALLVRRGDTQAVAMRMEALRTRFESRRAFLIATGL